MLSKAQPVLIILVLASLPVLATAAENDTTLPHVGIEELLDRVGEKAGVEFLMERRLPTTLVTGTIDWRKVDYDQLHTILRNNGLAAVRIGDTVNVVLVDTIRQYPIPIVEEGKSYPADLWVVRSFRPQRIPAAVLVPILRPLVSKQGHLVAEPRSNVLTMVARYETTQQLVRQIEEMDALAPEVDKIPDGT